MSVRRTGNLRDKGKWWDFLYKRWFLHKRQAVKETEAIHTLCRLHEGSHGPVFSAPPLGKHHPNNPSPVLSFLSLIFWDLLYWVEKHFKGFLSLHVLYSCRSNKRIIPNLGWVRGLDKCWRSMLYRKRKDSNFCSLWSTNPAMWLPGSLCLTVPASWISQGK